MMRRFWNPNAAYGEEMSMCVKEIWRYPVKSMAGEQLEGANFTPLGAWRDSVVAWTLVYGKTALGLDRACDRSWRGAPRMSTRRSHLRRSRLAADTLRLRTFDKISCLSRTAMFGMKPVDLAVYKASVMAVIHNVSPVELNRMIQATLDDGGGDSLPLLDRLRMENFARPKDQRCGDNARLLALANVPEFNEAGPLLDEVQNCYDQARFLWAGFAQHSSRVSLMKMSVGVRKLDTPPKHNT